MRVPNASMEALAAIHAVATFRDREKAAAALGIGVSALDKRLKSISQLLGADVLRFVGDGVELTEAGEIYRRDAERALEAAVLAEERAKSHLVLQERQLVVGHSTYLAPKALEMIHNLALPDNEPVSINHRAGLTADIAERVAAGTLHAAFGFLPIDIPGLTSRALFEEPIMVCVPSGHRLAAHPAVRPEELAVEPIVTVGREPIPALHEEVASYFAEFGIELNVVEDAFAPVEALALVEQGRGLCFLASSSITERRGVVVKALATKGLTRKSGVFVRSDQEHPLVLRLVEEAVRLSRELSAEKKPKQRNS